MAKVSRRAAILGMLMADARYEAVVATLEDAGLQFRFEPLPEFDIGGVILDLAGFPQDNEDEDDPDHFCRDFWEEAIARVLSGGIGEVNIRLLGKLADWLIAEADGEPWDSPAMLWACTTCDSTDGTYAGAHPPPGWGWYHPKDRTAPVCPECIRKPPVGPDEYPHPEAPPRPVWHPFI